MNRRRQSEIKYAQRESFLLREISNYFIQIVQDEPRLASIYIEQAKLSLDRSRCTFYFYSSKGKEEFDALLPLLILYKPSMRASLAKTGSGRYVPQLVFAYAEHVDQQRRVNDIIENLKKEGKL